MDFPASTSGRPDTLAAALIAATAFNNFASTIEAIMETLPDNLAEAGAQPQGETSDQPEDSPVTVEQLQQGVDRLLNQVVTLNGQMTSHDMVIQDIKAQLAGIRAQVDQLADPFNAPHRQGGPQHPDW